MTNTSNLGLNKPDYSDSADIDKFNQNADIIDAALTSETLARTNTDTSLSARVTVLESDTAGKGDRYTSLTFDSETKEIAIVDYDANEWQPDYILQFSDPLPVLEQDITKQFSLALQAAADPETDASDELVAYYSDLTAETPVWVQSPASPLAVKNGDTFSQFGTAYGFYWFGAKWNRKDFDASELLNYYTKTQSDALLAIKANQSDLTAHTSNSGIHVTSAEKTLWNDSCLPFPNLTGINRKIGKGTVTLANTTSSYIDITSHPSYTIRILTNYTGLTYTVMQISIINKSSGSQVGYYASGQSLTSSTSVTSILKNSIDALVFTVGNVPTSGLSYLSVNTAISVPSNLDCILRFICYKKYSTTTNVTGYISWELSW